MLVYRNIEYRFLLVLITSLGRRFPVSKAEGTAISLMRATFNSSTSVTRKETQKWTALRNLKKMNRASNWPPKKGEKIITEKLLYGTTCFLRFYGAYIFCFVFFFSDKKKKREKGDLLKKNFQCYTIGFFFVVCWTHGQTPGLSGIS